MRSGEIALGDFLPSAKKPKFAQFVSNRLSLPQQINYSPATVRSERARTASTSRYGLRATRSGRESFRLSGFA